jgi:transcription antitermination factor NusG
MDKTYAINTTRGEEFTVESELMAMGLHPWVPRILVSKNVKEKPEPVWFDRPYVPKLLFCVIPAIYYRDVADLKHVHGKPFAFTARDIEGRSAGYLTHPKPNEGKFVEDRAGNKIPIPAVSGLKQFKTLVDAEYADTKRLQENNEYQCQYRQGQALELFDGSFSGLPAVFRDVVRRAHDDYAKLRVDVEAFGGVTTMEVSPDQVRIAG